MRFDKSVLIEKRAAIRRGVYVRGGDIAVMFDPPPPSGGDLGTGVGVREQPDVGALAARLEAARVKIEALAKAVHAIKYK